MWIVQIIWIWLMTVIYSYDCGLNTHNGHFPTKLQFGVSTAAFQIEGGWNEDGRGLSMWDNYTNRKPSPIQDGSNANVACDSYHKYKEDVALVADLGVDCYRFSFSWTRILPNGYSNYINEKGIQYYKNLIAEIRKHNLIPIGTIFHWDLPQKFIDDGIDETNPKLIDLAVDYARIVIKNFPEISEWLTINEPKQVCHLGYGTGTIAPGISSSGRKEYQCVYIMLKLHAAIYRMYKKEFPHYKAKMSLVLDCQWIESKSNSTTDEAAAERQRQFECGMYFHPIYVGDWPEIVKTRINARSKAENLTKSRLPKFSAEEIDFIKGTFDFLALNHYYTVLAANDAEAPSDVISYDGDVGVVNSFRRWWSVESNGIFTVVPYGIRNVLNWLQNQYGDLEIVITELGVMENGTSLEDDIRIDYYWDSLCFTLASIYEDKIRVTAIAAWSILDNFEWSSGYTSHFGFYFVNFTDPERRRIPKKSVGFFRDLMKTRKLDCKHTRRHWPGPTQWDCSSSECLPIYGKQ